MRSDRSLKWLAIMATVSFAAFGEADPRMTARDVAFTAACDGTTQHYVLMLPKEFDAAGPHDVLVALHGHGSDRWQFASGTAAQTGLAARDVACERGMILVLPDYRAKTSWMGPKAEADVCQIVDAVKAEFHVGKVFVCGGSMGGSSALTFAVLHPELVAGVAAMNGTANHLEYEGFQDAIRASFGGSKTEVFSEYKNRSAEYWPERLTMPVGITASGKDDVVPSDSVRRLADVLEKMGRPVLAIYREDEGHRSRVEDVRKVIAFVIDEAAGERGS